MAHNRRRLSCVLGLLALTLIAAGCNLTGAASEEELDATTASGGREIIRFAFAPDPLWDYMKDTGILWEWESEHNLRIVTSESWDEYSYYAEGHGDIVSMATHELPLLEQETGTKVVAFGAYNHDRTSLMRRAGEPYNTIADVPEDATPCVASSVSTTILWSVIADQLHDIDYRVGAGKFPNIRVEDYFEMPAMLTNNDCTVAQTIPEAAVKQLRQGEFEIMYDGRPPWRVYQEDICKCDHKGMMSNLFVATEEWFNANPEEAAAFLELWERGIELWNENKEEIVGLYPQHFAAETEEDVKWVVNFMEGRDDWLVDTVYIDDAWIEQETQLYDYMRESGWMTPETENPRFEALPPPS